MSATTMTAARRRGGVRRPAALLAAFVSAVLVLSGCSIYDAPLPGGVSTGDNPMTIKVMFRDVLDLVPQSTVKVNDVTVGKVKKVELKGYVAKITVEIPKNVDLPDNARAEIRQTSLLGEKFVQLEKPTDPGSGKLSNGDTIGLDRTGRNPEVEEVLGALSLLLNGGGVGQLKTIVSEINNTLGGRESEVRSVLDQIRSFMGQLDANKASIVTALENTNRLAGDPAVGQPSTCRPGEAAEGARPSQRRRGARDQGVQGLDDQQPALAGARAEQLRRGRAEPPQGLPGLPHLPVRGRGRRPRPAGGPQPAHG
jgi:virulence factor Mce-like protein